jgi:hypothetical protein
MKKFSFMLVVLSIICMLNIPVFAAEQVVISEDFSNKDIDSYKSNFGFEAENAWGTVSTESKKDMCPLMLGPDDAGVFCAQWLNGHVMAVLPEVMPKESYIFTADLCASGLSSGFALRQTSKYGDIIEDNKSDPTIPVGAMGTEGICFLINAALDPVTLKITVQQKSSDPQNVEGVKTIATPITLPAGAEINPEPALTPIKLVDNGTMIIAYVKDIKVATIELSDLANDNYATAVVKDSTGTVLTTVSDAVIPSMSADSYMAFLNRTDYFLVDNFMLYSSDGTNDGTTINVTNPPTPKEPTTPPTGDFSMLPVLSVALLSAVTMLRKKKY